MSDEPEIQVRVEISHEGLQIDVHRNDTGEHWQFATQERNADSKDAYFAWVREITDGDEGLLHAICSVTNKAAGCYLTGRGVA